MTQTSNDQPKRRGRPSTGGPTPLRNVRIPDEIWDAAKAAAEDRAETLTSVIEEALRRYVARHRADIAKQEELTARIPAAISDETRAAVGRVVEYEIQREYGTSDPTAAAGARTLALAGIQLDLHPLFVEVNKSDRGLDNLAAIQLRIMVDEGLAERRCQCTGSGPDHTHIDGVRCGAHTEADVPPTAAGLMLCGTCYCAAETV